MSHLRNFRLALAAVAALGASAAHASFLSGEALDKAADIVTWVVIIVVPIVVIAVFWLVHILPEKVAEEREHPQKEAIKVICLLSLVFGGLLWPIAWILAYSKPVLYKMAYGRDRHEDYYRHLASDEAADARGLSTDVARLRNEIDVLASKGALPEELREIRARLVDLEDRIAVAVPTEGAG